MKIFPLLVTFTFFATSLIAQTGGIRGTILTEKGEALPFAGIYVVDTKSGTSSNSDAKFEIKLNPGEYQLVIQCLGYKTEKQTVKVSNEWVDLNIILTATSYTLGEARVGLKDEDPAYSIMRKAISMAKFYKYQVQEYSAKAYIKGFFKLKHIPFQWIVKKFDKENDLDTGKIYLTENVSEITFKQPNTYKEKVLSVSSNQTEKVPSPERYVNGSFYEPAIGSAISPLSPRAFSYYSFRLEGSYYEGNHQINKIKVTPRSKGDDVFEGHIYILDNLWSIHSINLAVTHEGITFVITQLYNEIQDKVWMPLTQSYVVYGNYLGFRFDAKYQVVSKNYKIKLNESLRIPAEIIDEKTEKEKLNETTHVKSKDQKELENLLQSEKKFTRKDMQKLMKIYEKEEAKRSESPEIVSERSLIIDSLAYKRDSSYWEAERAIPLSEKEVKSYEVKDSLISIEKKVKSDSIRKNKKMFTVNPEEFKFRIDSTSSIAWVLPFTSVNYNTVEEFNCTSGLIYRKKFRTKNMLTLSPMARYSSARGLFTGKATISFQYGMDKNSGSIIAEAGRYVSQFNSSNPISYFVNGTATLLFESNFMKLYEKEYYRLELSQKLSDKLFLSANGELANRYMLSNSRSAITFIDWKEYSYSSNSPANNELRNTDFTANQAFIAGVSLKYYVWKKYYINNGVRKASRAPAPEIKLSYQKGFEGILNSSVDFDLVEIGASYRYKMAARGTVNMEINLGKFLNNNRMYFMDYKHFMGNLTYIQQNTAGYHMLDYYKYSTQNNFAEAFLHLQPAKLLITQFMLPRMIGLKEDLIVNYLYTPTSKNYMELGYGIDQIFRGLRLEVVSSFAGFQYQSLGFRIGFSTRISSRN
ncbi:MAG: carboxypeptidase-like regulatory domain-containing protein [Bacteroidetes bacterium]|nr:carboxypeptidase-like regulatory domain-containing protein [Bacteroidota bacterium]